MSRTQLFLATALTVLGLASAWSQNCGYLVQQLCYEKKCVLQDIEDQDCLKDMVRGLKDNGKKVLELEGLEVDGLPAGLFRESSFHTLFLNRYKMKHLNSTEENPFLGLEGHLRRLYFMRGIVDPEMHAWSWHLLAVLKLEHIIISQAPSEVFHPTDVLPQSFKDAGSPSVKVIEITASCLKALEPKSLSTFTGVQRINLSGNRLTDLSRDVFPQGPFPLQSLDLSGNRLTVISSDNPYKPTFWDPDIATLTEVYLDNNGIKSVHEDFFTDSLLKFRLNGNQLDCTDGFLWIFEKKVNLSILHRPGEADIRCGSPRKYRGALLSSLQKEDLEY